MILQNDPYERIVELIFKLRQKCALRDLYFVKSIGITQAEYNCLIQFLERDSIGVKGLSKCMEITPGGVTRIITSLEKKGYVERKIDFDDRRQIDVILTEKGKKIVDQIRKISADIHKEIFDRIDLQSQEAITEALEKLLEALDFWFKEHEHVLEAH